MSVAPEGRFVAEDGACPLCGAPVEGAARRCPDCGLDLAGVGGRPGAYSRPVLWWTVAGFLAIYVVVVVVVALAN